MPIKVGNLTRLRSEKSHLTLLDINVVVSSMLVVRLYNSEIS